MWKNSRYLGENTLLGTEENRILKPEVEFENVNSIAYISNGKKTIICVTIWVEAGNVSKLLENKRAG